MFVTPWYNALYALKQNKPLRQIVLICFVLAFLGVVATIATVSFLLSTTTFTTIPWVETGIDVAGGFFAFILSWFLFPVFMPILAGLMEDPILKTIHKGLKEAPQPQKTPFWQSFFIDIRLACIGLVLNILCFPFYFVPVLNIIVYYLLNGYLLSQSFFTIAARYYLGDVHKAHRLAKNHKKALFIHGCLFAFLATLPVISLSVPFLGVLVMVYMYVHMYSKAT